MYCSIQIMIFFINYCYIYAYIPKYINAIYYICIRLLECIFLKLIIWYFITNWYDLLCGKKYSLTFSISSLPVVFCIGLRLSGLSPVHVKMSTGVILVQLMLSRHTGEILWAYILTLVIDAMSQQTPWSHGPYNHSTPSSLMILEF